MFAPARIPVAEGKKMENMPKKLPSGPRQLGTKFAAKMPASAEYRAVSVTGTEQSLCGTMFARNIEVS